MSSDIPSGKHSNGNPPVPMGNTFYKWWIFHCYLGLPEFCASLEGRPKPPRHPRQGRKIVGTMPGQGLGVYTRYLEPK